MRRDRFTYSGLFLVPTVLLASMPAGAQPSSGDPHSPSGGSVGGKTADEYALEGRELALKNDLDGAYRAYLKAWSLKRSYDIAGNLGVVEFRLGKARDAAEHLAFCERNYPAVRDAAQTEKLTRLRDFLEKARAQVGEARVYISADDHRNVEGAEILVDGQLIGRWPLSGTMFVDAGSRMFSARIEGCKDATWATSVERGKSFDATLTLSCRRKLSMPILLTGIGVAAVGVGLGIGAAVQSGARSSTRDSIWIDLTTGPGPSACNNATYRTRCDDLVDADSDARTFRGLAIGGLVVGGAAAIATTVYVLTQRSPSRSGENRTQVSFSVAPGGGAAVLRGMF